jgi:long-chain acyl-CoA synthetase
MTTLVRELERQAQLAPGKPAHIIGGETQTYADLARRARAFAGALIELGLGPGDRVSLYLPSCLEYGACFYGSMRGGMVANPINGALTAHEVEYLLRDSGASALVTSPELMAKLRDVLDRLPGLIVVSTGWDAGDRAVPLPELLRRDDEERPYPEDSAPACLPYSSGTTGNPKGIVHTHGSLSMQAVLSANRLQLRSDDVLVHALPLVHLFGGNIVMGGLLVAGATMVVQPTFEPAGFAELLHAERATACAGVPTQYAMLVRLPDEDRPEGGLDALEVAFCAGAPLAASICADFAERFGARVLDCYGITEAAGNLAASLRYGDTPPLSCGLPYPMTEIRIVDGEDREVSTGAIGELTARGPQIMAGYWERPDATETSLRGGWLHTGDMARVDDQGFLYIVDRKQDLIITGGYNVYPAEVEKVLQSHPDVVLCAVFAVEDEIKGEKPWAAVVPARADVDVQALEAYCRERLASYKVPRRFLLVDDIPRSSVGKLLRRELRKLYSAAELTPSPAQTPITR